VRLDGSGEPSYNTRTPAQQALALSLAAKRGVLGPVQLGSVTYTTIAGGTFPGRAERQGEPFFGRLRRPPATKENPMRTLCWLCLACLALMLSSCAPNPRELIIGKWEFEKDNKKGTVEFIITGNFTFQLGTTNLAGKYRFVDDATVEVELKNPIADFFNKLGANLDPNKQQQDAMIRLRYTQVRVTRDELRAVDQDGREFKARRVQ
jgi:hypothetical protein